MHLAGKGAHILKLQIKKNFTQTLPTAEVWNKAPEHPAPAGKGAHISITTELLHKTNITIANAPPPQKSDSFMKITQCRGTLFLKVHTIAPMDHGLRKVSLPRATDKYHRRLTSRQIL